MINPVHQIERNNKMGQKVQIQCLVTLPDKTVYTVSVDQKAIGQECLEKVKITILLCGKSPLLAISVFRGFFRLIYFANKPSGFLITNL